MKKVACPVCENYTLSEPAAYEICPVCFWEDEGFYDNPDEVSGGPNHELSLNKARKNYKTFGACSKRWLENVREPEQSELPKIISPD